jgi:hypothetical protein
MSRFAILLLAIVWVPVNADAQSKVDLAGEVEQLLRIHESARRPHLQLPRAWSRLPNQCRSIRKAVLPWAPR